jgi:hypothetical protein
VDVERPRVAVVVLAPDLRDERVARHEPPGFPDEHLEEGELLRRKLNGRPAHRDLVSIGVDRDRPSLH